MIQYYGEIEEVGFTPMPQVEKICYIHHDIKENDLSELNSFSREEKMTNEDIEVPMCRINLH